MEKKIVKVLVNLIDKCHTVTYDNKECEQFEYEDDIPMNVFSFVANSTNVEYHGNYGLFQ